MWRTKQSERIVDMLSRVNESVHSLFYHLRENPALFTNSNAIAVCNEEDVTGAASGTKAEPISAMISPAEEGSKRVALG